MQRIRYALAAVKKVGLAAMAGVAAARGERPFANVAEFSARIDPKNLNKMQLENLARAGAFDSLNPNRAQMFAGAETVLRRAQANAEEAESGQIGLFAGPAEPEALRLPAVPEWAEMDRLGYEAEAVGFHLTAHPLDSYAPGAEAAGRHSVLAAGAAGGGGRDAGAGGRVRRFCQGADDAGRGAGWRGCICRTRAAVSR